MRVEHHSLVPAGGQGPSRPPQHFLTSEDGGEGVVQCPPSSTWPFSDLTPILLPLWTPLLPLSSSGPVSPSATRCPTAAWAPAALCGSRRPSASGEPGRGRAPHQGEPTWTQDSVSPKKEPCVCSPGSFSLGSPRTPGAEQTPESRREPRPGRRGTGRRQALGLQPPRPLPTLRLAPRAARPPHALPWATPPGFPFLFRLQTLL